MKLNDRLNLTAKLNRLIERDTEARADFLDAFKIDPAKAIARHGENVAIRTEASRYAAEYLSQLRDVSADDFQTWAADGVGWLTAHMIDALDRHLYDWSRANEAKACRMVWEAFTQYI